jgi:hypothetical protein
VDLGVTGVLGDERPDARRHGAAVLPHIFDEVPGDAVVDAGLIVLAAIVAEATLGDAPQAGEGARC